MPLPTKVKWTIQLILGVGPATNINPLYGYEVDDVEGVLINAAVVEPAAVIRPCTPHRRETRWCAEFVDSVRTAYAESWTSAHSRDGPVYVGTTYPIGGVDPAEKFLSRHTPPDERR